jgi:hypothetical protein
MQGKKRYQEIIIANFQKLCLLGGTLKLYVTDTNYFGILLAVTIEPKVEELEVQSKFLASFLHPVILWGFICG